ncbi:hypothetical protein PGUG_00185 [Meyerozyma guilliermondii ATCC 6260]|uniref:RRM domain-containing protein n=1 Tax=Meyerozyma guilliermondii (strain ATCC 6260 / CBS 566 / DSM 6381 / JCM 1539 / NBRC 10279 / NRRL Y-324) TaxID=294746 RepID=A5DA80_PICGU|nr:uncharacterized protein PGUG_00185 [Meyerozyma guilliermondii ATCC 6260]EDK36087.2 hypothetical protein PGUG_00185 [Meyerozyma guilliermondii ATCC 6260]
MKDGEFPGAPPHPSLVEKDPAVIKNVDERVLYEKESQQWVFERKEEEHTVEYVYNFIVQQWVPRPDLQSQKENDESVNKQEIKKVKKEKIQAMKDEIQRLRNAEKSSAPSTSGVFVSKLPSDVTSDELFEIFSKYGVIAEDFKTNRPRIKLYYDQGQFKNEALVIYHNKESVYLAIDMLDNSKIRSSKESEPIKVEPAAFSEERDSEKAPSRVLTAEEKQLLHKKKEMLKQKVSSWDDEDPSAVAGRAEQIRQRIWKKSLVIENMFRVEELKNDKYLESDIIEDIKSECDKYGIGSSVTKVSFFDVERVVVVRFDSIEAASQCRSAFDGRYYDGLKIHAREYAGEKFSSNHKIIGRNEP